jgi:hypothetical protein
MMDAILISMRTQPARWAWWLVLAAGLVINLQARRWEKSQVVSEDVVGYYAYLPAAFIYGDVSMQYCTANRFFSDKVWGVAHIDGLGPVQKYTMGTAVLHAPFFFIAHAHAHLGGFTPDGYSWPYRFWLQWSGLFYLMLGLWILRRLLALYFQSWVVALTLLGLGLGTNLLYYSAVEACMPHVGTFAVVAALMWVSLRWHAEGKWSQALAVGLLASLLTLIRPNHVLFWSIPLLAGVLTGADLRARMGFLLRHWAQLLLWAVVLALVVSPQLFYWKHLTGLWLYYSYGEEGFFFRDPKLWQVLVGFRKGWLVYTPMMGLALLGWWQVRRSARPWFLLGPLLLSVVTYVLASWWCWWYGGSFGHRGFIDLYPLLAMGLAAGLEAVWTRGRRVLQAGVVALVGLLIVLNVFQAYQYHKGLLHWDSMTARAYWSVFGRMDAPTGMEALREAPDYGAALRGEGR